MYFIYFIGEGVVYFDLPGTYLLICVTVNNVNL